MSDQTNQPEQASNELRQSILSHLEESKKIVEELNDEELEAVAGGGSLFRMRHSNPGTTPGAIPGAIPSQRGGTLNRVATSVGLGTSVLMSVSMTSSFIPTSAPAAAAPPAQQAPTQ